MLDDILLFAAHRLVDGGRLGFWMPTANDEEKELAIPTHPCLELVAVCVQPFRKCASSLLLSSFFFFFFLPQPTTTPRITTSVWEQLRLV